MTAVTDEQQKATTTYLPLDYLLEHINLSNPKDHDVGLIVESIERHGFRGAVQFDPNTDTLVAGHGRLKALVAMRRESPGDPPDKIATGKEGWLVPVKYESFPDEIERDAYTLSDNSAVLRGGWNTSVLADFLQTIAERGDADALKGTGFDGDDLDLLLADRDYQPPPNPIPLPVVRAAKGTGFGVTVNVETREEEARLVEIVEANGFWAKRHSG